eukprot:scaffold13255_cov128-Isochrysis_galbana.AAC.3
MDLVVYIRQRYCGGLVSGRATQQDEVGHQSLYAALRFSRCRGRSSPYTPCRGRAYSSYLSDLTTKRENENARLVTRRRKFSDEQHGRAAIGCRRSLLRSYLALPVSVGAGGSAKRDVTLYLGAGCYLAGAPKRYAVKS